MYTRKLVCAHTLHREAGCVNELISFTLLTLYIPFWCLTFMKKRFWFVITFFTHNCLSHIEQFCFILNTCKCTCWLKSLCPNIDFLYLGISFWCQAYVAAMKKGILSVFITHINLSYNVHFHNFTVLQMCILAKLVMCNECKQRQNAAFLGFGNHPYGVMLEQSNNQNNSVCWWKE